METIKMARVDYTCPLCGKKGQAEYVAEYVHVLARWVPLLHCNRCADFRERLSRRTDEIRKVMMLYYQIKSLKKHDPDLLQDLRLKAVEISKDIAGSICHHWRKLDQWEPQFAEAMIERPYAVEDIINAFTVKIGGTVPTGPPQSDKAPEAKPQAAPEEETGVRVKTPITALSSLVAKGVFPTPLAGAIAKAIAKPEPEVREVDGAVYDEMEARLCAMFGRDSGKITNEMEREALESVCLREEALKELAVMEWWKGHCIEFPTSLGVLLANWESTLDQARSVAV